MLVVERSPEGVKLLTWKAAERRVGQGEVGCVNVHMFIARWKPCRLRNARIAARMNGARHLARLVRPHDEGLTSTLSSTATRPIEWVCEPASCGRATVRASRGA